MSNQVPLWCHPDNSPITKGFISLISQHYSDIINGTMASQITSLTTVYLTVYLGADQRKHQSSAPLAFVWGIHQWPVNSPNKWPVTRKMFPFGDVIMKNTAKQNWKPHSFLISLVKNLTKFRKINSTRWNYYQFLIAPDTSSQFYSCIMKIIAKS